jgi:hypothetical protein
MAFNGKLVELKTGANYVEFPLAYIKSQSYHVTPNQRMESSANRATTGLLHRTTVLHTASKIDFETPPLTNSQVNAIHTMLANAYTDSLQRKLNIRYYDPSSDSYKTGTFYVPDVNYDISRIEKGSNTIHYDPVRFAFIEY